MTSRDAESRQGAVEPRSFAPVPAPLRRTAASVLNRLIEESTPAGDLAHALDGKSFVLELEGVGLTCVLVAHGGRIEVDGNAPAPTATLRATPLDLLTLARRSSVASLRSTRAEVRGDVQIAEQFADLLKLARPDLEEELSRWIGDLAAHEVGRAARGIFAWLERAGDALTMNTSEYLQEESRALPAALEAQAFFDDVERLRDDVERAAARLTRLEQRTAADAPPQASSYDY